jgi:hypothetical protein
VICLHQVGIGRIGHHALRHLARDAEPFGDFVLGVAGHVVHPRGTRRRSSLDALLDMFSSPAGPPAAGRLVLFCDCWCAGALLLAPFYGDLAPPLLPSLGKCSIEKQMLDTNSRIDEYLPIKIIFAQKSFTKPPSLHVARASPAAATQEERARRHITSGDQHVQTRARTRASGATRIRFTLAAAAVSALFATGLAQAEPVTLNIASINNPDMIELQKLAPQFEKANPDIKLRWVTMEESVLRQRLTTDIATNSGQFDVMTIGAYEAPIWAKGWLRR